MSLVSFLLSKPFAGLEFKDQMEIKRKGRPKPELTLEHQHSSNGVEYSRKFRSDIYDRNDWICGCEERNALFCFPCILFGGDGTWCKYGMTDLVHLAQKILAHENTENHIGNVLKLALIDKERAMNIFDFQHRNVVQMHNEDCTRNRHMLNLIINSIRYCEALEYSTFTYSRHFYNRSDLINFDAEMDTAIQKYKEKACFKEPLKVVHKALLKSMLAVYHSQIKMDISNAKYVSLIVQQTSTLLNPVQFVMLVRYIIDGAPVERFWKLIIPHENNVDVIAEYIIKELKDIVPRNVKLISQCYDGAAFVGSKVSKIVQETYKDAHYVQYYDYSMQYILANVAAGTNLECKIFFDNITSICAFFTKYPKHEEGLTEVISNSSKYPSGIKWDINSKLIKVIYDFRHELIDILYGIENNENNTTGSSQEAGVLARILQHEDFAYWIDVFKKVMPQLDFLITQLHILRENPTKLKQGIEHFESTMYVIIKRLRIVEEPSKSTQPPAKKRCLTDQKKIEETEIVCKAIMEDIRNRFNFNGVIATASVFDHCLFKFIPFLFPEKALNHIMRKYPFITRKRLEHELTGIYRQRQFDHHCGLISLYNLYKEYDLNKSYKNTFELLNIAITTPMVTADEERCFSTLKKIQTFLSKTQPHEDINTLIFLAIDTEVFRYMDDFNNRVIEFFTHSSSQRKLDFNYRTY